MDVNLEYFSHLPVMHHIVSSFAIYRLIGNITRLSSNIRTFVLSYYCLAFENQDIMCYK